MNNMQAGEEVLITGYSLASARVDGRPAVGNVLTFTITGPGLPGGMQTVTYTVQQSDFDHPPNPVNPPDSSPLYSIALNSARAITLALQQYGYAGVGVMPSDNFAPAFLPPYFGSIYVLSPTSQLIALAASATGGTNLFVDNPGQQSPVRRSLKDPITNQPVALYGYIAILDVLAMDMAGADISLWLTKADVVGFRPDEVGARIQRYRVYCEQMERALGGGTYVTKFGSGRGRSGGATA